MTQANIVLNMSPWSRLTCVSLSLVFKVRQKGVRRQPRPREGKRSTGEGLREGVDKSGRKGGRSTLWRPPGAPWGGHIRREGGLDAGEEGLGQREGEREAGRGRPTQPRKQLLGARHWGWGRVSKTYSFYLFSKTFFGGKDERHRIWTKSHVQATLIVYLLKISWEDFLNWIIEFNYYVLL